MLPPIRHKLPPLLVTLVLLSTLMQAGGPAFVAGTAFDPAMSGKPILWANGAVSYYTDQGDLSALLPQSAANDFVADAFSRWSAVGTVALTVARAGALAEDVNGSNVVATGPGVSLPVDIQPTATKPFAVVYDLDGSVTDKLLGAGASDPSLCATNSVFGGADHFSTDGHIAHALLIVNGRCAQTSADLAPLKYHLIRAIGRALGVGWSQANDNVQTGTPFPTNSDYAGFPLMHPLEPFCAGAITTCIPNADKLREDDRAAISRLYPVTAQNAASFPGKQIFTASTVRIHGSVYFPDVHGNAGQPMQGVNIVARLIDPDSGQPSRNAVVSSVSGSLFRGNAGNPVSGYGSAQRFDGFGGADAALEGLFDLAGLELPVGHSTASFQITLEAVNPLYHDVATVGPYSSGMVTPSGAQQVITVSNVGAGDDVTQNIVMLGASTSKVQDQEVLLHRPMPLTGDWWGAISGYGRAEFYRLKAQAGRTVGMQLTSVNEPLRPTANKLQPELGLWVGTDPSHTLPQSRGDFFNGTSTGVTVLSAPVTTSGTIQLGIADYRGDGRPDFAYHAHFLYADSITPSRIPGNGATLQIKGIGFRPGMAVMIGGNAANVLSLDADSIFVQSPVLVNGLKNVTVQDTVTGLTSTMTGALTVGVISTDTLVPVSVTNAATSVGTIATNPLRFRIVSGDGVTPVAGAAVTFSVSPVTSLVTNCNASSCVLTTDAKGEAAAFVLVNAAGANAITVSLSNGQTLQATILGTSSLTLSAVTPRIRVLTDSSPAVSLPVRLMNSGAAVVGGQVNYSVISGSGVLSTSSAITDSNGQALATLTLTHLVSPVTVNACTAGAACAQFSVLPVATSVINLQTVSGDGQMIAEGQTFQPIQLLVVDSATPPNAIANIPVTISGTVVAESIPDCVPDTGICRPQMPHVLSNSTTTLTSNAFGVVSYTPTVQAVWGAVQVGIVATAGASASQSFNLRVFAPPQ